MISVCCGVEIILCVCNLLLHSSGSYLLLCLHRARKATIQQTYNVNISVTLIVKHCLLINFPIFRLLDIYGIGTHVRIVLTYIQVNYFTGIGFIYYASIFYITFDRLFGIITGIRYRTYWNSKRTKRLVFGTWMIGICLCIVSSISCAYLGFHFSIYLIYIYVSVDILFMVLAFCTYCIMFAIYFKSKKALSSSHHGKGKIQDSLWKIFYKSRFFISVILIINFMAFQIIPDFIYIFGRTRWTIMSDTIVIASQVADLCDGFIYIFLHNCIRRLLMEKCGRKPVHAHSSVTNNNSDAKPVSHARTSVRFMYESKCWKRWLLLWIENGGCAIYFYDNFSLEVWFFATKVSGYYPPVTFFKPILSTLLSINLTMMICHKRMAQEKACGKVIIFKIYNA